MASFTRHGYLSPLTILLISNFVVSGLSSHICSSEPEPDPDDAEPGCSAAGSAMLQASFASTQAATNGKASSMEHVQLQFNASGNASYNASSKEQRQRDPLSIGNASDDVSTVQKPVSGHVSDKAKKTALKATDEVEHAPTWLMNLVLFIAFVSTIFCFVVSVLGVIEMIVRSVRASQAAHLETLDQEADAKKSAVPAKQMEQGNKAQMSRKKTVEDVSEELSGFSLWKRLNGDSVRLGILLEIANSDNGEARTQELVAKACKAFKLKLSMRAICQASYGLLALAKAVQQSKKVDFSNLRPKEKFQEAGRQVMAMVKVSRAFNMLLSDKSHETSSWALDNEFEQSQSLENKYHDGEQKASECQDARLSKSAVSSYFASRKWIEHTAIAFVFLYSQSCALLYALYLKTRFPKMYAFMGPWLLLSRGEAMAVIVLTMLMVTLLTRGLITRLRPFMAWSSVLQTIADKHVLIHKWIGVMLVVCAVLHIVGHLLGSIPAIINETDRTKIDAAFTYGTKIKFNFNSWAEAGLCWPAMTGYLLVLILIAFWSLSNERARRYWFELFHYPHLALVLLWCGALIAHGWEQWLGLGVPIASVSVMPVVMYYLIERILAIRKGSREGIVISNAVVKKSTVLLEIDTGSSGFAYDTGMYCMVKCPTISDFQWHPFTIASGGGHSKFNLLFAVVGDWTTRLKELIVESQKVDGPYPPIAVRGGYGAPAQGMRDQKNIIMVGAGVGCTPFLSFLSTICNSENNSQYRDLESAVFYWLSREPEDFVWVNQYNSVINGSAWLKERVAIRLCMTKSLDSASEDINAAETGLFWMGMEVALTKLDSPELSQELGVPTQFGRPKWEKEFAIVAKDLTNKTGKTPRDIGVFACGNKMLVKALEDACTASAGGPTKFRLYAEEF